jgi:Domain of unknown function (DUF389)
MGVLISVTTIPAAANVAVGLAYGDEDAWTGSLQQLAINIGGILLAGVGTLYVQRMLYLRRRRAHRARLPIPSSRGTTRPRSSSGSGRSRRS